MNIINNLIACVLGLIFLALGIACSVLWSAFDKSSLAKKDLNRVQSGYRWTAQDMVDNHCRRKAADLTLRLSIIFRVSLIAVGVVVVILYLLYKHQSNDCLTQ